MTLLSMCNKFFLTVLAFVMFPLLQGELQAFSDSPSSVTFPVGELGASWNFPSDHLPVGLKAGNIHAASWNVLNTRYIYHILTNQQGLKESLIVTANIAEDMQSALTIREKMILGQVLEMLEHPTHPRSILSLQEVGDSLYEELKRSLSTDKVIVTVSPDDLGAGDIFIYDSSVFEWCRMVSGVYQSRPKNTYMTLALKEKETGLLYHFVQSHVPAAPGVSSLARMELVREILSHFDPKAITIVMGDMNRSPDYFLRDFEQAAKDLGILKQPIKNLWIPYPTHIDCNKRASWIDNLFFHCPSNEIEIRVERDPAAFFFDVIGVHRLLRELRPHELDVSFELWSRLKAIGKAVVVGTPCSGKKEQIALALKDENVFHFNLREEFLSDYLKANHIGGEIEKDFFQIESSFTGNYRELEYEWIKGREEEIIEEILISQAEIVLFEDFDHFMSKEADLHKFSSLMVIVSIAKRASEGGKKMVFAIEHCALGNESFWNEMSNKLGIVKEDVIDSKYLKPEEEITLLEATTLTEDEKLYYKTWAAGIPSAYLSIMEFLLQGKAEKKMKISLTELMALSLGNVEILWSRLRAIESQEVIDRLQSMALDEFSDFKEGMFPEIEILIKTGLVRKKDGQLYMPNLVREVIRAS